MLYNSKNYKLDIYKNLLINFVNEINSLIKDSPFINKMIDKHNTKEQKYASINY
jgi:hypothetical protein